MEKIYYYKFTSFPTEEPMDMQLPFEVILVKADFYTPSKVWVRNETFMYEAPWAKIPSPSYAWWWNWFKTIKHLAIVEEEITKVDLFGVIGIALL